MEPGDFQEARNATHAIGDDRLQMRLGGEVIPGSFIHGTSQQRMSWFTRGLSPETFEKVMHLNQRICNQSRLTSTWVGFPVSIRGKTLFLSADFSFPLTGTG